MKKTIFTFALFFGMTATSMLNATAQTPQTTPPPADDGEVVKISTALVQVDVTVTDKNGKVITDLKPDEVEIYENGVKQDVSNFSFVSNISATDANKKEKTDKNAVPPPPSAQLKPEQIRRTVALVVDDLSLSFQSTYYVQRALRKFVNEQMRDGDLVAIIRTGAGIGALQQFTSDKRQLLAAIEKVRWNPVGNGGIGAFAPIETTISDLIGSSPQSAIENGTSGGGQNGGTSRNGGGTNDQNNDGATDFNNFRESVFSAGTLGAVNYIVRGMRDLPGRKSVMLMSDGFTIYPRDAAGSVDNTRVLDAIKRLVDAANRSSVVIYTMDARGLQTLALTAEDNVSGKTSEQVEQSLSDRRDKLFDTQSGLIYLAKQTGGLAIYNNNDLSDGIETMLEDQSYYLIGYQPDADTFDAAKRRYNKLTIKIKRDGAQARYRSGFFGVSEEKITAPTNLTPAQQIQTALTSPFAVNDVALRLNTLFGNDKNGSFVRSLIHISAKDFQFTDEADGTKKASFDILAVSFGDNGAIADQISKNYTLTVKPDAYQKLVREGFVYFFTFPVKKPGAFQYRVAVRDVKTGKVGSANQFIEVPNLKKNRLTASGIVLENFTLPQWNKMAGTSGPVNLEQSATTDQTTDLPDPLTSTSLRQFKRGTIMRYACEIYNAKDNSSAKPNLTVQVKIFRDNKPLLEGKKIPVDLIGQTDFEHLRTVGALNLGTEMAAGEYILQIIVADESGKGKPRLATQFVQFEIVD